MGKDFLWKAQRKFFANSRQDFLCAPKAPRKDPRVNLLASAKEIFAKKSAFLVRRSDPKSAFGQRACLFWPFGKSFLDFLCLKKISFDAGFFLQPDLALF